MLQAHDYTLTIFLNALAAYVRNVRGPRQSASSTRRTAPKPHSSAAGAHRGRRADGG